MSWSDREFDQGNYAGGRVLGPLRWMLNGSVPLGRWFGVQFRAHIWLLLFIVTVLLIESSSPTFVEAWVGLSILLAVLLLHELGHHLAAKAVGGFTEEINLWPLGGLTTPIVPRRPLPAFIAAIGGLLANLAVCLAAVGTAWALDGDLSAFKLNPFHLFTVHPGSSPSHYLSWVFGESYLLLLFNLLPILPLDGGRILQTLLWPNIGYFRSMVAVSVTGMLGALPLAMMALVKVNWVLLAVAVAGFMYCLQQRAVLRAMGADEFNELIELTGIRERPRRRRMSRRAVKRARRQVQREQAEQERIDSILAKVSSHGIHSLSWLERRALHKATERQRQRDLEYSQDR